MNSCMNVNLQQQDILKRKTIIAHVVIIQYVTFCRFNSTRDRMSCWTCGCSCCNESENCSRWQSCSIKASIINLQGSHVEAEEGEAEGDDDEDVSSDAED